MRSRAILVVGMHRSGTSALTGVLNHLGVEVGPNLIPGNDANVRGYWENADIWRVHERILGLMGTFWSDPCPLPEGWWEDPVLAALRGELIDIVRRDFRDAPVWAVKDPRLGKLLPLWQRVLAELECDLSVIIPLRDPGEIAASLAHRDGFTSAKAYLLWLDHVLSTEATTRETPRAFVDFEELLSDWRRTAERVAQDLEITWPRSLDDAAAEIDEFLSPEMRHHRGGNSQSDLESSGLPPLIQRAYTRLRAAARDDGPAARAGLSTLRRELTEVRELFCPQLADSNRELVGLIREEAARHHYEVRELEKHARSLEEQDRGLAEHVRGLEEHVGGLEEHVRGLEEHVGGLEEHVQSLEEHLIPMRRQNTRLLSELSELRQGWEQARAETSELMRTLRSQEAENARLREHAEQLGRDVTALREESQKLQAENDAHGAALVQQKRQNERLQEERRALSTWLSASREREDRAFTTLRAMEESRSWRMTRPFRSLVGALKAIVARQT